MLTIQNKLIKYSDHIGVSGSFFCLIHCIITSGVLILSTASSHIQHHHDHHHLFDAWAIIDLSMVLISGLAIHWATSKSTLRTKKIMWIIFAVYALSMLFKYVGFEPLGITIISYTSSLGLIVFHLINLKHKHNKSCACN